MLSQVQAQLSHWFSHPQVFFVLAIGLPVVLLALAVLAVWSWFRRRRALTRMGNLLTLGAILPKRRLITFLRGFCVAAGITLLVIGAGGPQWGRDWEQTVAPGRDVVVVLDLSRSMLAEQPSRLSRSRAALLDLCRTMQNRGGHRLALVVFAGRAKVLCPLTHDYEHFRDAVASLGGDYLPPDIAPSPQSPSGTRIGEGLRQAVQAHDPRFRGFQDILLVSDGDDPVKDDEWRLGTVEARAQSMAIYTIGVGDPDAANTIPDKNGKVLEHKGKKVYTRLHERPLKEIARLTNGAYIPAQTRALPLGQLFRDYVEARNFRDDGEDALPMYRQRYQWFFGGAFFFLALDLLLGRWPKKRRSADVSLYVPFGGPDLGLASRRIMAVVPSKVLAESNGKFLAREKAGAFSTTMTNGTPSPAAMLLAITTFVLTAAAPILISDDLVRLGNEALGREDYAAAMQLYEDAEARTIDPGLVAYNEATACYHLGNYARAESYYRLAREDAVGPRRSRVLYGMANCLLQQAGDQEMRKLEEAIDLYKTCMRGSDFDVSLHDDAQHNLELAKLLWMQAKARSVEEQQEDPPPPDDQPNKPRNRQREDPRRLDRADSQMGSPDRSNDDSPSTAPDDPSNASSDDQPSPGNGGNLPTIPDKEEVTPMSLEDATQYLRQAVKMVQTESRDHRMQSMKPPVATLPDW